MDKVRIKNIVREILKEIKINDPLGSITNFKAKHGSEGPSHDPYGYTEYTFEKGGRKYKMHFGLSQWIEINGKKTTATGDDYDNEKQFIKKYTGINYEDIWSLDPRNKEDDNEEDPMGGIGDYI